ncbi:sensor histidine kinase [Janthinobacterium sp. GB4P2]|uniref:sensor histidine kinase n=1 Tax=Janthinobacterium sp. GB4P2 TaxID=3424189 RepID=UPI003F25413F
MRLPTDFRHLLRGCPDQFFAQHGGAATWGAFVHMMLMSLRLNRRYAELRRVRDLAQAEAVRAVHALNERLEEQVALRNLLSNADRHVPQALAVRLRAVVPVDEISCLFQKYFRGRIAQHKPGAGLGLYLVQRIAELHGGKATLDSAGMDGIVNFSLHIPAWINLDSRLNQSGIAQVCSLINLESLLHFPLRNFCSFLSHLCGKKQHEWKRGGPLARVAHAG